MSYLPDIFRYLRNSPALFIAENCAFGVMDIRQGKREKYDNLRTHTMIRMIGVIRVVKCCFVCYLVNWYCVLSPSGRDFRLVYTLMKEKNGTNKTVHLSSVVLYQFSVIIHKSAISYKIDYISWLWRKTILSAFFKILQEKHMTWIQFILKITTTLTRNVLC